jgi:hypothetical protein
MILRWRRALVTGVSGDVDISLTSPTPVVWAWSKHVILLLSILPAMTMNI